MAPKRAKAVTPLADLDAGAPRWISSQTKPTLCVLGLMYAGACMDTSHIYNACAHVSVRVCS